MRTDRHPLRRAAVFGTSARATWLVAGVALATGCIDLGDRPQNAVIGQLTVGPGVVFLERGHVQQGVFERGGLIDEDGSFAVDVPVPGPWGVHLYLDDYFYLPLEVQVAEGLPTRVVQPDIDWATIRNGPAWEAAGLQPDDPALLAPIPDTNPDDNPTIWDLTVTDRGAGAYETSMQVEDPAGDLSKQVLVLNTATGTGVQMNAPSPPVDDKFPNGEYRATLYLPSDADPHADWVFVAANHGCNNSPVSRARVP